MKHPPVVLKGLTKPALIYTVHNPYVPNPLSVQMIDKIRSLAPRVECCIFGTSIKAQEFADRNAVAIFDGPILCGSRRFKFLVIGEEMPLPKEAEWARRSQWGVALGASCKSERSLNCAQMIVAHFVEKFSLEEIAAGNYPWGPRKTAKRKPRKYRERSRHLVGGCQGFFDHTLGL